MPGCCRRELLGIPHLLSFKATFEAFLDVVQRHIGGTFSYDQPSAERSRHFSWEIPPHPSVHFLPVWTVALANRSAKSTHVQTHVHCIGKENAKGKEQYSHIFLFLGGFHLKSLGNSLSVCCCPSKTADYY